MATSGARRRLVATAAAVLMGTAAALTAAPAHADDTQTTVTVDTAHPSGVLPADFVGLS